VVEWEGIPPVGPVKSHVLSALSQFCSSMSEFSGLLIVNKRSRAVSDEEEKA
jgi:hypothetical protein